MNIKQNNNGKNIYIVKELCLIHTIITDGRKREKFV